VCLETFPGDMLAVHASSCGETVDVTLHVDEDRDSKTLDEALGQVFDTFSSTWEIAVIRRHFRKTSMEQLDDGCEEDWGKKLKIRFIGEEGIDEGGLSREFFTMLFRESQVFEDSLFSADADLLSKQHYKLMGKVTAMALLSGHPGPRCLEQHLVDFIVLGKSPDMSRLCTDVIKRQDVMHAIEQIQKVSDQSEGDVNVEHVDLLDQVNFRRRVTKSNKEEAVEAIKAHFLMYRCLPGLLQYMEGLKVNSVLDILKKYPESKKYFIKPSGSLSASEVMGMYSSSFSKNDDEKSDEEMVIYNMHQFLKNVERGRVTTVHIDIYAEDTQEDTKEVTVTMEQVFQSLTGCAHAPSNLAGSIYFDHLSAVLSSVNTCVPSINFSSIKDLRTYKTMEAHMLHIIFGTLGFGIV